MLVAANKLYWTFRLHKRRRNFSTSCATISFSRTLFHGVSSCGQTKVCYLGTGLLTTPYHKNHGQTIIIWDARLDVLTSVWLKISLLWCYTVLIGNYHVTWCDNPEYSNLHLLFDIRQNGTFTDKYLQINLWKEKSVALLSAIVDFLLTNVTTPM
jgi:hypothetical protein